jgi:hypothetical protein
MGALRSSARLLLRGDARVWLALRTAAVRFNHDANAATQDALNIPRNATHFISVPEWRRFICVNPEDSAAAYAVVPTQGKPITIEVSLLGGWLEAKGMVHTRDRSYHPMTQGKSIKPTRRAALEGHRVGRTFASSLVHG